MGEKVKTKILKPKTMKHKKNEIEKQIQDVNIPTEKQIIQKSLEFQKDVEINQFLAGAMWIKSILLKTTK